MSQKVPSSLPKNSQQKAELINKLKGEIGRLQAQIKENSDDMKLVIKNQQHIEVFRLRSRLIKKCGEMSLVRLSHLQQVFRHYCTHVFRVGRYMTFDRLQYQKVHMTMERFFLFLKDFELTIAQVQGKKREVVDKQNIITIFKKVSSNSRQLSFEEFIQSIEKLAILYWNQKTSYSQKRKQYELRMQSIKKENEKRRKKRMKNAGSEAQKNQESKEQNEEGEEQEAEKQQEKQVNKKSNEPPVVQNNENDDFVNELMNNEDLEDPNQQVREVAEKAKRQNQAVESYRKMQKAEFESLLELTEQEKIEFYYELFRIDSVASYKQKMTELNLANYIVHRNKSQQNGVKALSQSKLQAAMEEQERLQKLKAKMNEKKEKQKEKPLPKPSNQKALREEQNSRRRRQAKKEREMAVKDLKVEQLKKHEQKLKNPTPKIEYKEGEVSFQMLQKLTLEHLRIKNFNPSKYYTIDEEDKYFLDEYGGNKPKMSQRFQARDRQSQSIVQSTKMRAQQLEKRQNQKGVQRHQSNQNKSFSRNAI